MGLLSMMDAILDQPMVHILAALPLSAEVKSALLGQDNPLHDVFLLVLAHEKGDWAQVSRISDQLKLSESEISRAYLECVSWTHNIFKISIHSGTPAAPPVKTRTTGALHSR